MPVKKKKDPKLDAYVTSKAIQQSGLGTLMEAAKSELHTKSDADQKKAAKPAQACTEKDIEQLKGVATLGVMRSIGYGVKNDKSNIYDVIVWPPEPMLQNKEDVANYWGPKCLASSATTKGTCGLSWNAIAKADMVKCKHRAALFSLIYSKYTP